MSHALVIIGVCVAASLVGYVGQAWIFRSNGRSIKGQTLFGRTFYRVIGREPPKEDLQWFKEKVQQRR